MNKNLKIMISAGVFFFGIIMVFSLSRNTPDTDKSVTEQAAPKKDSFSKDMPPEAKAASAEAKASVRWYSYNEGVAIGKDKKKKMFLSFYADWCGYCKQMERTTFSDKSVVSYMNENFVPIRINADKELGIASNYNVRGLPDTWFLSENAEEIGSQPGYIPPDTMLPLLKYIHSDNYKKMSFDKFMKEM